MDIFSEKDDGKIPTILKTIFSLWLSFFGLMTIYNNEDFFSQLFSVQKFFWVIIYIVLKLCPIAYNAVKKNYNKCLNSSIGLLIWMFLFTSCNIAVEATKNKHPSFRSIGYFKYFGVSNTIEIIMLVTTVILIYALLNFNPIIKASSRGFKTFVYTFSVIKIISVAVFAIFFSSASYVCNLCFYSLLCGAAEYTVIFVIAKKLQANNL